MKKFLATKKSKWLVAAAAVLLLAVLLAPVISAKYADSSSVNVNVGLTGNPLTDVDNLFIYMMNESLPVGSIYITQSAALSTVPQMNAHFGGTWEVWGTGRAPAGVNATDAGGAVGDTGAVLQHTTHDQKGGTMNVSGKSATISPLNLSLKGTTANPGLTLSAGNVTATAGSAGWNGNATVNRSGSANVTSSSYTAPLFSHTHTWSWSAPYSWVSPQWGGSGSNYAFLNNSNSTVTHYTSYHGSATTFTVSVPLNLASWTATVSLPTPSYVAPTAKYTQQNFSATGNLRLPINNGDGSPYFGVTGSGTVTWTDQTIQPYETVYMYRRLTLANLNPLT